MQFGVIYLRSGVHPLSFEQFHALELVKQSRLKSNILFATFTSEAPGIVEYGFDGNVACFQETSGHAWEMFDIALRKPVKFGFLLEELQTISEGAVNRKGTGFRNFLSRLRLSKEAEGPRPKWGVRKD